MGRDQYKPHLGRGVQYFNPRARMGRDTRLVRTELNYVQFQSTRPHGARQQRVVYG